VIALEEELGPAGFEAIHAGFECRNIRLKRSNSLVELRKRQSNQRAHFLNFVSEFPAQVLEFMPDSDVTLSDLSDIASE
jgi:hypothetical protein